MLTAASKYFLGYFGQLLIASGLPGLQQRTELESLARHLFVKQPQKEKYSMAHVIVLMRRLLRCVHGQEET